jgi:hypothetical protein
MSRSCSCGVNWRSIRVPHAQSRRSAASATSSCCRSNRFEEWTINDENMAPQTTIVTELFDADLVPYRGCPRYSVPRSSWSHLQMNDRRML